MYEEVFYKSDLKLERCVSQKAKQSKLIYNFVQASKYCSLFGGGSGNKTKSHGSKIGVVRPGAREVNE